ncbi:double-stranded RNA-specific editase Adar [Cylas formicarius]|uniref:double-stranded RNA-specific editase Adar n=1 Tax=Cylas formicarius TaxID=197179 RepID=UPI002958B140|nr:double-stranded RNA-specific editase Adar [Cylas formicarius]
MANEGEKLHNEHGTDVAMDELNNVNSRADTVTAGKRSIEEEPQKPQKKKKKGININAVEKNPVSILNELRVGLKYEVDSVLGPPHSPIFKVYVTLDGQKYYGTGSSKKTARACAAEEALKSFIQFPNNGFIISSNKKAAADLDFTVDQTSAKVKANGNNLLTDKTKSPVMVLNELYPNASYSFIHNDDDTVNRFQTTITIANETFSGTGSSKKNAKVAAAKTALMKLRGYCPIGISLATSGLETTHTQEKLLKADAIKELVMEKFQKVLADDLQHTKRKVLAGIVMTRGPTMDDAEVICVTTGTKCVSGEHMSLSGASLNDMHAEIIARRCLINYFYDQLELLTNPGTLSLSIFEQRSEGCGYRLKKDIEFHLYINTAPCGDARVFSTGEDHPSEDRHPNRISRGQLRTKVESGEGTIPIKGVAIQTWDGIIQGERLLTMSCSDKICKWNVVGVQGALLAYFIEPVYLKSLVVGGLMKESHLYRAICGRIENVLQGLPPPFLLNRPEMLRVSSNEIRQVQKAPSFAVLWCQSMHIPEIVNTEKGRPDNGISLVCKQKLASRFSILKDKLSNIAGNKKPLLLTTYEEVKQSIMGYAAARQSLYEAFSKACLGKWITKPMEQDLFEFCAP